MTCPDSTPPISHTLTFRFEPLILSIECRTLTAASTLLTLAVAAGYRESGIMNVQVGDDRRSGGGTCGITRAVE